MKVVFDLVIAAVAGLFEKVGQKLTASVCAIGAIVWLKLQGQLDLYTLIGIVVIAVVFMTFRMEETKIKTNATEVKQ